MQTVASIELRDEALKEQVQLALSLIMCSLTGLWAYIVVEYAEPLAEEVDPKTRWILIASAITPYALAAHYAALVCHKYFAVPYSLIAFTLVSLAAPLALAIGYERLMKGIAKRRREAETL